MWWCHDDEDDDDPPPPTGKFGAVYLVVVSDMIGIFSNSGFFTSFCWG